MSDCRRLIEIACDNAQEVMVSSCWDLEKLSADMSNQVSFNIQGCNRFKQISCNNAEEITIDTSNENPFQLIMSKIKKVKGVFICNGRTTNFKYDPPSRQGDTLM